VQGVLIFITKHVSGHMYYLPQVEISKPSAIYQAMPPRCVAKWPHLMHFCQKWLESFGAKREVHH
jgi:hypothetical protein